MSNALKDYFYYTKKERLGVLMLLFVVILLLFAYWQMPHWVATPTVDLEADKAEIAAFEAGLQQLAAEKKQRYTNKYANNRYPSNQKKDWEAEQEKENNKPLRPSLFDPNTASAQQLEAMQLPERTIKSIINYRNKGGQFRDKESLKKIYTLSPSHYEQLAPFIDLPSKANTPQEQEADTPAELPPPFNFDPNTADLASLQALGITTKTSQSIINYRSKGGQFRTKEDLKKIYGFPPELYEHLTSYIVIAEQPKAKNKWQAPKMYSIDINTAAAADFEQFRGIGASFAKRIIKYRLQLGGFVAPAQVGEVYGLADSTLQGMLPYLTCPDPIIQYLDINLATVEQLKAHPYLRWFHAKAIVTYREKEGKFSSVEMLQILEEFDDNKGTYQKIHPYLTINK